ncbi:MAG: helix-turn-helix domain-containing GNAT family N-acetyltransferase [Gammaproteobacteria bacterium]|nr:helix-turn-helix domain-containing GNAT family N-acetyltransferase [Gammaproteobacteria bacterium]
MGAAPPSARIEAVRRFNRYYTRRIGVLHEHLLSSGFSLAQARVVYELAHRDETTASELAGLLGIDNGYLSRLVAGLAKRGLLKRQRSRHDGRQSLISLSKRGRDAFAVLDARSRDEIGAMLGPLPECAQRRLVRAMSTIHDVLDPPGAPQVAYVLRPHEPGDLGWVVHRHGALYAQEYGFDASFEALVAKIAADFLEHYDARRARCWMAEVNGDIAGSVLVVPAGEDSAKLRLLLVEPWARGLGIGRRLVRECIRFARRAGYGKLTLWTNDVLHAARRLYEEAGFVLVDSEAHDSFGQKLVGENWELVLDEDEAG